jgi:mannose-6-phosphate isomerase-like protein (cupin superfamily)
MADNAHLNDHVEQLGVGAQVNLAVAGFQPGSVGDRHYHRKMEEIFHITSGEGVIEIDGEEIKAVPGVTVVIPVGKWHSMKASGTQPLEFIAACSPPHPHNQDDVYYE